MTTARDPLDDAFTSAHDPAALTRRTRRHRTHAEPVQRWHARESVWAT